MGAHLSTINSTVQEEFTKHDEGSKGYLVTLLIMMHLLRVYGSQLLQINVANCPAVTKGDNGHSHIVWGESMPCWCVAPD